MFDIVNCKVGLFLKNLSLDQLDELSKVVEYDALKANESTSQVIV